jgi:glycosidase
LPALSELATKLCASLNVWPDLVCGQLPHSRQNHGAQRIISRERRPIQVWIWDTTRNAGFATGNHTWEPATPNYLQINTADQVKDPDSVYHYNQKVIALRRSDPAFIYGDYQISTPEQTSLPLHPKPGA